MKKLVPLIIALCALWGSCQRYDDSEIWNNINSLDERVSALEKLCKEMNSNIDALQALVTALENRDYITNVAPIQSGGVVVGYAISFAYGESVTIYHGQDGQDGADGAPGADGSDGQTPVIGVRKDADGVYYWTLNGEWLLDGEGNKISTTGKDGAAGQDGVTPQLKIENGMWYVSYDNGMTWSEAGKATGDQGPKGEQGAQGNPGADGDPMFKDIDFSNGDYVIFTLSNGTTLKIPTWSSFESLKAQVEQMNKNISALQQIVAALQDKDYVTGITPVYDGVKEIGYIITFSKSGSVTIYHGKAGADGQDGQTPVIGVRKDADGVYYWTLNGEWLLDGEGNKIPTTGKDGAAGQDGVTPQLKVEAGRWHISYDNCLSWTELGQATGDQGPQGDQGPAGEDGDSFFRDVDCTNSDYVIFTLADGTQIQFPTWSAFESLKSQVEQMNKNISALQQIVAALQDKDYVTGVTPVYDGVKEIGYIITFSKSGSVTIYHGKAGADGQDGQTPVIGVRKDADGVYYWTLNGEWLLDGEGNKISTTGKDGAAGQDGVTPQLKVEAGRWHISYDNGLSWTELGQAIGDQGPQGDQGPAGEDGDSFFRDVDCTNSDYVIFTLADGTQIQFPTWSAFESLKSQVEQMNKNISALQQIVAALQDKDYVTGITPVYDGVKEIGYIITFSKSGSVTIYHGKAGADGQDGQTPVIGVRKDADGVYYWTLNGEWLLDGEGNKISTTGKDGAAGQDGVTPQLKVEAGRWHISYDNCLSWTELGQATGDQGPQGDQGPAGEDGDSFFRDVDCTNSDYVIFTLADGTQIRVPMAPEAAASISLTGVTGFTATFEGKVLRHSLDLKVTVYYGTTTNLTIYKHTGKGSVTEFSGDTFTLKLTDLAAETTYYYFSEIISKGSVTYSEIDSFVTGKADAYVDWEEGENVGGEI